MERQQAAYLYGDDFLCENCLKKTDIEWYELIHSATQEAKGWRNRLKLAERNRKDLGSSTILSYNKTSKKKNGLV